MWATSFEQIRETFVTRAHAAVWCNFTTIDERGRPRSRLLHAIWDGQTGYIATRRHSPKARDIAHSPYVSVAYVADVVRPVYVECEAEWADDPATKAYVWNLFVTAPPPLGYDPAPIFVSLDDPDFGVLRLIPQRIELADVSGQGERRIVWRPTDAQAASSSSAPVATVQALSPSGA